MKSTRPAGDPSSVIRICIIEDHEIVRAGLRMLIESQPGMEVVCETGSASTALTLKTPDPHVVLLDLDLGGENGLNFIPAILNKFPSARVLILTGSTVIETHLAAVQAGAAGVVVKEQAPGTLVRAIQSVRSGDVWLARSLMTAVLGRFSQSSQAKKVENPEEKKIALLTARELEIVTLVGEGLNRERIAEKLHIADVTVRNHLTSIFGKLGLANKFELVVYAYREGLSSPKK